MANTFFTFGIVCFVLAGIFFATTIVIFFKANIRSVIAELSGKSATDAIANIRKSGGMRQHKGKSLQSILDDVDSGELGTAILNTTSNEQRTEPPTTFITDEQTHEAMAAPGGEPSEPQTALLANEQPEAATTLLIKEESEPATTLLINDASEPATALLSQKQTPVQPEPDPELTLLNIDETDPPTTMLNQR